MIKTAKYNGYDVEYEKQGADLILISVDGDEEEVCQDYIWIEVKEALKQIDHAQMIESAKKYIDG